MKSIHARALPGLSLVCASVLLVACGSSSDVAAPPAPTTVGTTAVPIAATQESAAAFSFVEMVVAMGQANTEVPLVLSDAANDPLLATSETADPMPVTII